MDTIRRRRNSIWKIKDAQGNLFEDQYGISQVIMKKFQRDLKQKK